MSKISTYPKDTNVTGQDLLVGSDWNTPGKITKNFSTNALASYFNKSAIIDTGQFSWEFLPYNNTQPQPEKTFMKVDWLDDTININNLAGVLRVSALTLGNTQPGAFIENEWVGNNILVHIPNAPSAYAIYTVDALVPDGDWYYLMNISYVGGQSFTILKNDPVVMGYFAGVNVITEITGTFPIIVSEGSIPDVSIDPTVKGEWDLAYDNSIVSAAVTGTSTKTLTLTQQDGGTITASWTDEDTNLVTSVFGRTGAVVAVSGDYNTSQVTESTNLYFTQARAIASPITGYNPTLGTITATDTILTAINKLAGSYVPYTGATNNVNLGEKGITAGYVGFDLTPTGTPTAVGTMYWDTAYRTVSLIDGDGDTTLQIGQEERILVHNNTGSTLTDGQVVYVTGSTGNLPSVALASAATESTSAATIGMITETILNGADGFITVSGIVNGLNTLAFNEGDLLWLSDTPGGFTTTKPISPSHLVLIGYVIKKAGGNGSVLVKIQNTQELSESSDVLISAPEIDGQGLFLQTISGVQLWRNRSIVDVLGYTPADEATIFTINGTSYNLSTNRTWSVGTVTSIAVGLGTSGTDVNVSGSPITSSGTITLNIPSASAVNRGLLTPTDWSTFNNKQDAGNYITSLTGEATASGPGAAAVTLSTPAVTGKLLTGVNITGGTVVATDTILEAFGKVQNQINGLVGGSIYKGTWNASTNTPTITSGVGNTGWYYIVSVAGSTNIDGITDWNLGDWIIFDGTAWQQVDNTDAVVSVNGYTGAVSLVSSDVPEGLTNLYFTNARARGAVSLTTIGSSGAATYNSDSGVFNIPDYGSALSGYLPLTGGTLTGGLYINPQNTSTVGLDVASNTITFRSDNLEGFKRQLTTTMSSGTLVKIQAAGYGGTYVTDLGFYTSSNSAVNTTPNLYLTGGDNRVGINTVTPNYTLDVNGTSSAQSVYINGDATNGGALKIKQYSASVANEDGYNSISTLSTGVFYFTAAKTTPNFKNFVLDPNSLTDNTLRTYTLPNASGTIALTSNLSSYVPYTGATGNVNLGNNDITAGSFTGGTASFATSGAGAAVGINHSSGAGIALNISKSGSGEGIYVNKTSGTGNAVTIIGTLNATTIVKNGGTSSQYLMADGSVSTLTNPITGTGTSGQVPLFNGTQSVTNSQIYDNGNTVSIGNSVTSPNRLVSFSTNASGFAILGSGSGGAGGVYAAVTSGSGNMFQGSTSNGGYFISDNAGNTYISGKMGIGTFSSSSYNLNVVGTGNFSGDLTLSNSVGKINIGSSDSYVYLNRTDSYHDAYIWHKTNGATKFIVGVGGAAPTPTEDWAVYRFDGSGFYNTLTIKQTNGNVLIGTTSDNGSKFQVSGAATFSSSVTATIGYFGSSTTIGFGGVKLFVKQSTNVDYEGLVVQSSSNSDSVTIAHTGTLGRIATTYGSGGTGTFTDLAFATSGTDRLYITSSGNVGIGTTSPTALGSGYATLDIQGSNGGGLFYGVTGNKSFLYADSGGANIGTNASLPLLFLTAGSERMRITSGGQVLIGQTAASGSTNGIYFRVGIESGFIVTNDIALQLGRLGSTGDIQSFYSGTTRVGTISVTGAATFYNSISDYRLKQDFKSINGLDLVNRINVYNYEWKSDKTRMDGVIAHELAEVLPYAVNGVKDGEQMQSVDYSKIVPVMVQAIKELKAELDTYTGKNK